MQIRKKNEKKLIEEFIKRFTSLVKKKSRANKRFSFVLTGGSSPKNLYKEFSKMSFDWSSVDFFWGDERFVSNKSKYSNFRLAKNLFLKKINIDNKHIFPIKTNFKNVNQATNTYQKSLKSYFKLKKNSLDLILLGMGDDGHVASIFQENLNNDENKIVKSVIRKDFQRVSISLKTINTAKNIYLWLNNKKKTHNYKKFMKSRETVPVKYLSKKKTKVFLIN